MKAPRTSTVLRILLLVGLVFGGCVASMPLATWLWWAVPPVELYYSEAYFSSAMAHGNPTARARVQWLYKTAPDRLNQLAEEDDVVADSPANQSDFRIPMHLSSTAQSAGWSGLIQGPREEVNAAELEKFLRAEFYRGRSFWRLFEWPLLWMISIVLATLAVRDLLIERSRRESANRLAMWSESQQRIRRDRWEDWLGMRWSKRLQDGLVPRARSLMQRGINLAVNVIRKTGAKNRARAIGSEVRSALANRPDPVRHVTAPTLSIPQPETAAEPEVKGEVSATDQQADLSANRGQNRPSSNHPKKPAEGHRIFPGTSRQSGGEEKAEGWDESQWID